jgi:LysR family glycine cleavage system transcriptional activator
MAKHYPQTNASLKLNILDVTKEKIYLLPMDEPSHLRSLQALELALRTGSLKGAAAELAITPAAVGQRVKALEDYLGVDLVVRGRSGLQPTPELAGALPHLHAAFRELAQAAELLELQRGQQIRIAAPSDVAELWLAPRLPAFRTAHPNIDLVINGEGDAPRRVGVADCEIFFGPVGNLRPGDERRGEVMFHDHVLPITSPENERRVASLGGPAQLEGFPLLHVDFYRDDSAAPKWPDWLASQGLTRTAPERGIRFQRIAPAVDAVLANAGFAMCGIVLLRAEIDAGRVSLPFPISSGRRTAHAFQMRFRAETLQRPQLRRFRQWLLDEAAGTRRWLEPYLTGDTE